MLQGVFCIDDYLTTYMLKTRLVFCSKWIHIFVQPSLLSEEWSYLIYYHLELRLVFGRDLSSLFDLQHFYRDYSFYHCCDPVDMAPRDKRACCLKRKNLTVIATYMRKVLQLDLKERHGRSTELLDDIAMEVCLSSPEHWFAEWTKNDFE